MNKKKRLVWRKHLKRERKVKEKRKLLRQSAQKPQETPA
jgi:hypothetical protein